MSLNKSGIVDKVSAKTGKTKRDVALILQCVIEEMAAGLINGDCIRIADLGSFNVRVRKSRKGINPHTGEAVVIPECRVVAFKSAKCLSDALQK